MKDIQRETSGDAVSKKLPKLGDNMDSDEDDDDGEEEPDDDYEKGEKPSQSDDDVELFMKS